MGFPKAAIPSPTAEIKVFARTSKPVLIAIELSEFLRNKGVARRIDSSMEAVRKSQDVACCTKTKGQGQLLLWEINMLDRDQSLKIVQEAYEARVNGDKDALARYWAPNAHFEINGDQALMEHVPLSAPEPMEAISVLVDQFRFSDLQQVSAVVEGNNIAVRWAVTIHVEGKPPARSQLFDLIELDDDGRITSFVQFADTALIRHLAA